MDRSDFDKRMNSARRQGQMVGCAAMCIWLAAIAAVGFVIFWLATADPKEVARDAGEVVREFKDAAK